MRPLILLLALASTARADWRDDYRLATLADIRQTLWFKQRASDGWIEHNRLLKRTGPLETALIQAAFCELEIYLVSRLPKKWHRLAGVLAVANRASIVAVNARKCPVGFVCPIVSIRF